MPCSMSGEEKKKENNEEIEMTKSFLLSSLPLGALRTFVFFISYTFYPEMAPFCKMFSFTQHKINVKYFFSE